MPIFSAIGASTGVTMVRAGAVSSGIPISSSARLTSSRNTQGEVETCAIVSMIRSGICSTATTQANGSDRPSSSMTTAVSTPDAKSSAGNRASFRRR